MPGDVVPYCAITKPPSIVTGWQRYACAASLVILNPSRRPRAIPSALSLCAEWPVGCRSVFGCTGSGEPIRHGEPNTSIRVGFRLHERVRIMVDAPPVTTLLAGGTA